MISVNLTTTRQRLQICKISIISILMQSKTPDKINLWVSNNPYLRDQGIRSESEIREALSGIPKSEVVNIKWVDNIGPYRKLIPALRESSKSETIITADDDIYYGSEWLEKLLDNHDHSQKAATAARVRKVSKNFLGKNKSYLNWVIVDEKKTITEEFIITFGGGAVLNKSLFRNQDIYDDSFLELSPTADDLWYSKLLLLSNTPVRTAPEAIKELNFITHDDGLVNHNFPKYTSLLNRIKNKAWEHVGGNLGFSVCGNDEAHKRIERHFNSSKK